MLTKQLLDLCHEIEKLPASDQQTKVSAAASDIYHQLINNITETRPERERYPDGWVRVELMISPDGEMHAIGGDRKEGLGDQPYIGLERMKTI